MKMNDCEIITPPSLTNSAAGFASRRRHFYSENEYRQLLDSLKGRVSDYENKRLQLDEEMMRFQRESEKNTSEQFHRDQEFNERFLLLKERCFQLDSEERRISNIERQRSSNLLSSLTK